MPVSPPTIPFAVPFLTVCEGGGLLLTPQRLRLNAPSARRAPAGTWRLVSDDGGQAPARVRPLVSQAPSALVSPPWRPREKNWRWGPGLLGSGFPLGCCTVIPADTQPLVTILADFFFFFFLSWFLLTCLYAGWCLPLLCWATGITVHISHFRAGPFPLWNSNNLAALRHLLCEMPKERYHAVFYPVFPYFKSESRSVMSNSLWPHGL